MIRRLLILLAVLAGATVAQAQGTSAVKAIDTTTGATTDVGDATNKALRVTVQNPNASPVPVLSVDSGGTAIVASTLLTHDSPLTASTTTGSAMLCRASSAAPTNVSTNDDAVLVWCLQNGSPVVNLAASGTLVTATGTSANVNCTGGCSGGTQYTQDGALTVATTVGTMALGRASAAAPTDVNADNDAVIPWFLRSGAAVHQISFGGVLATTGNGVAGTGVQRVAISSDNTAFTVNAAQSGTWTVQPGNTQNTTPWLATPFSNTTAVTDGVNVTYWANQSAGSAVGPVGDYVYNGATWDRLRGDSTNGSFVNVKAAVQPAAPTTVLNGNRNVTTAGTRVTLTAGSTTAKGVTICAKTANTGVIYVGSSTVTSANGRALIAGECQSLAIADLQTVNLDSSVNGEGVTYLGVN